MVSSGRLVRTRAARCRARERRVDRSRKRVIPCEVTAMYRHVRLGLVIAGLLLAAGCGPTRRALPPPPDQLSWDPRTWRAARPRRAALDPKVEAMGDFLTGEIALNDGNYDVALRAFRAAVENDPSSPLLQLRLAMLLVRQGRARRGARALSEASSRCSPSNTEARLLLAGILSALNRQDEAVAQYKHVHRARARATRRRISTSARSTASRASTTRRSPPSSKLIRLNPAVGPRLLLPRSRAHRRRAASTRPSTTTARRSSSIRSPS